MQQLFRTILLLSFLLPGLAPPAQAQISSSEGVNLPGTWYSNFSQPPAILPLAGIQKTAPNGQFLVQTTLPTRRYHSVLKVASSGGDVTGGSYNWLFTSGPTSGYFNNKWANVTVSMNTVQTYTWQSGPDNSVTLTNGKWYTINLRDNGYANTSAVWLETATQPVVINNVSLAPTGVTTNAAATVTATIDASLPADQYLYLRYATDAAFTTNHNVVPMTTGGGTSWSATIPSGFNTTGRTVRYYVFSSNQSNLTNASANLDLFTIKFNNNNTSGGYAYTVTDNITVSGATTWSNPASWASGMVPASGTPVTIGHNLTLDQNATVSSLIVTAGTLSLSDGAARLLTADAVTVASGATLSVGASTLSLTAGGTLTNNGTFNAGSGTIDLASSSGGYSLTNDGTFNAGTSTVSFRGTTTVGGGTNTTFYNADVYAGVNFGASVTSTIQNSLSLYGGGFVNTNPPAYSSGSALIYRSGGNYGRSTEWNSSTVGAKGFPTNVQVTNSTNLNVGNTAPGTARRIGGNLLVDSGSGFYMDFGANDMTQAVTIDGNITISGALSLSDVDGGDLKVGGNFVRSSGGTFNPKGRAVFFDGAAAQTIQGPIGGQVDFDYLLINNNSASGVQLASNVNVNATAGAALQLNGKLDLLGRTLQLINDTDLQVQNATRTITSSAGTGTLIMRSNNAVTQTGGGSLIIDASVRVVTGGAGVGGISFGGVTTINGTLELQSGGFVDGSNNNGPLYGPTSTVRYNIGGTYGRRSEWDGQTASRTPFNVEVTGNTYLNAFDAGASTGDVDVRGNLTIEAGSTLDANTGTSPFEVQGNVSNAGTLKLSTNTMGGGDLKLGGDFVNTGSFVSNGRAVYFTGAANQSVASTSPLAINYVVVQKSGGQVQLSSNLTVGAPGGGTAVDFSQSVGPNVLNLNGQALTIGAVGLNVSAGTVPANSGFTDTGAGTLAILGDGDFGTLRFTSGTTLGTFSLDRSGTNAGATVVGAPTILSQLTLAGLARITLTTDNLTLGTAAMLTGADATRYLVTSGTGALARQGLGNSATLFPVGTAASYNPATLTNAGTPDTYRVRVSAASAFSPPRPDRQINRFWTIDENTLGGSDVTLRLQWNQNEEGMQFARNNGSGLRFTKNSGAGYTTLPATLVVGGGMNNAGPYVAQSTGIQSFSEWSVGNPNVLPVELMTFEGQLRGPDALLTWRTASEKNNDRFVVERSIDARTFVAVGSVPGAGTSSEPRAYELTDPNVARLGVSVIYYRLRQIDIDGTAALSGVVALTLSGVAPTPPTIFPNPTIGDAFTVQFFAPAATTLTLTLTDVRGSETYRGTVVVSQGYNYLNSSDLPGYEGLARGLYVAKLVSPDGGETFIKLVRQ